MDKKYELTDETIEYEGHVLHRIRALKDFNDIDAGDLGGFIESERNLSHDGNCWVYNSAKVFDHANVCDDAEVSEFAIVKGFAVILGTCEVCGSAIISGNVGIGGVCIVSESAQIAGSPDINFGDITDCAFIQSDSDYIVFHGFGRNNRTTTMYRQSNGSIGVSCGCFHGTLNEFKKAVRKTHGFRSLPSREYRSIIRTARIHFKHHK